MSKHFQWKWIIIIGQSDHTWAVRCCDVGRKLSKYLLTKMVFISTFLCGGFHLLTLSLRLLALFDCMLFLAYFIPSFFVSESDKYDGIQAYRKTICLAVFFCVGMEHLFWQENIVSPICWSIFYFLCCVLFL